MRFAESREHLDWTAWPDTSPPSQVPRRDLQGRGPGGVLRGIAAGPAPQDQAGARRWDRCGAVCCCLWESLWHSREFLAQQHSCSERRPPAQQPTACVKRLSLFGRGRRRGPADGVGLGEDKRRVRGAARDRKQLGASSLHDVLAFSITFSAPLRADVQAALCVRRVIRLTALPVGRWCTRTHSLRRCRR